MPVVHPAREITLIIGAAVTEKTAGGLGEWADGLITISQPIPELKKAGYRLSKKWPGETYVSESSVVFFKR